MKPGDVIADRFEIEREAGAGGMGTVFRARDRHTGHTVAMKVLVGHGPMDSERFVRESSVLAGLTHPGIVRFVATGTTAANERYLVMEWLEGEDLDARLARAGLTLDESVAIVRHAAEALAIAHARGVVHRDIKPGNLFLVGGDPARVKVLDFGIARRRGEGKPLTRTGVLIGTPEYMAPEQARGSSAIDARVDVFALGCVLFECISGRPAFNGDNLMAVLAKILLEDAPRLAEVRHDVPAALDDLVSRMLAKDPARRPGDAGEVAFALAALGSLAGEPAAPRSVPPPALTAREQRVVCVAMAKAPRANTDVLAATMVVEPVASVALASAVAAQGARLEVLADGSSVAILAGHGTARDEATRAARVALAMRKALPDLPIVLLTGRGIVSERLPVGEVIDRAVREIEFAVPGGPVRVDEATAGLVDTRFDVAGDANGLSLRGERRADGPRTVLGRATACVGRDREISALVSLFDECIDEPVARVALVTAPAGAGKSRVLQEFLKRIADREPSPSVFVARGDPMSAGSPLAMLAFAIRAAAGIREGENLDLRQRKLRALVSRSVASNDVDRVTTFLGELAGAPHDETAYEPLRAARLDPMLMNDSMLRAFTDWLAAECAIQPVAFVFEDLHWGDLPTVDFTDAALRLLENAPLFVLALSRPEVHEQFPRLWSEREPQEFRLAALTKKACEKLVREVLGGDVSPEIIARLVERSEGNAFFLEELMRAVGAGMQLDVLPDSVLGTVQSRIDGFAPEARRVLRAASIFGQTFWRGGVLALLGSDRRTTGVIEQLDELEAREVIVRSSTAPRLADTEYVFRHALVRDAAYAMLTPQDRTLGHKLAGQWLEAAGLRDPVMLAEHFDRGGNDESAARWYGEAAEQALDANDLARAVDLASRGIAKEIRGPQRWRLLNIRGEARYFRGEHQGCVDDAAIVAAEAPVGSWIWFSAQGGRVLSLAQLGRFDAIAAVIPDVMAAQPEPDAVAMKIETLARACSGLAQSGRVDGLAPALEYTQRLVADTPGLDIVTLSSVRQMVGFGGGQAGDPYALIVDSEDILAALERLGNLRRAAALRNTLGVVYSRIGEIERGYEQLRRAAADAERIGAFHIQALVEHNLSLVLRMKKQYDESIRVGQRALAAFERQQNDRLAGACRIYLADTWLERGDALRAEHEAHEALRLVGGNFNLEMDAHALLARTLVARGRLDEALVEADKALERRTRVTGIRKFIATPFLAKAEVLLALGRFDEARAVIDEGERMANTTLERIADLANRERVRETSEDWRFIRSLRAKLG
jgi:tetratricopeptide (TPR) repeat protein